MARREIHNVLDRKNRKNHNENYEELFRVKKTVNSLVLESGESNAEVVQARGGEEVLNDRLEGMENAINSVANTSDVEVSSSEPENATIWFEVVE